MNEAPQRVTEWAVPAEAPAGYRLGDPIALEDLLALPPDGRRYTRDDEGRLALMAPDHPRWHRTPLSALLMWLVRRTADPLFVSPEPGIAFSRIWSLEGHLVPLSRLGPRTLEPDAAVFSCRPSYQHDDRGRARGFETTHLRLIVEVLSPSTHRQDLGLGAADQVDRFRTYLDSGVPEYWVLNPHPDTLALPPRTGLFLRAAGERWEPLPGQELVQAGDPVQGLRPVSAGRVTSEALDQNFDVAALWSWLLPG